MNRIKELRKEKGISQKEMAAFFNVTQGTFSSWETGRYEPDNKMLQELSSFFGVSIDYLLGHTELPMNDNIHTNPRTRSVPLVGRIACGEPILAEQHIERYIDVIDSVRADFALTCVGDSMTGARIYDGDVVFVRQQPTVENGEIAAVLIDDEATLKRVYFYPSRNCLVLKAENPKYDDLIYYGEEINSVRILGKAIYFVSMIRH